MIVHIRALQTVGGAGSKDEDVIIDSPEEVTYRSVERLLYQELLIPFYRRAIEQEKTVYKENFDRLKTLKPEIEHITKVCRFVGSYQFIFGHKLFVLNLDY
jgi:hypothetical protein